MNRAPRKSRKKQFTVGSLFAGMGGFCLAFEREGFRVVWANEKDNFAAQTYRHNFPRTKLFHKAIQEVSVITDDLQPVDVMTAGKDLTHVSVQTIRMISGLVNRSHDGVTIWIAAALGEFGQRASFAAPRLIEVLRKVECDHVDASSAFTIRTALKKMGKEISGSECSE